MSNGEHFDVAVVGGGVAGLAAATALAQAGRRVLVVEARGELGGRATAFTDRQTGELVDNGQHVMFGCYHETFRLLRRIGAESNVRVQNALEVPYLDAAGNRSVLRCPPLPSPLHLVAGILEWDALPWSERFGVLRMAGALRRARKEARRQPPTSNSQLPTSNETVAEWLTRHGQQGRIREWLWEPLAVAALNQPPAEAAAAPFVRVLALMFGPDPSDAAIVLPRTPLHEMYAHPARRYIEARGGEVRLHAPARVRVAGPRVRGLDIRGEPIDVPRVIAAVPWFGLETLFTGDTATLDPLVQTARRMQSKAIVTVNLWYDGPVMDDEFVGLPGRSMQWVFDKRRVFGSRASHLSLIASSAGDLAGLDIDALVTRAAREIAEAIPGACHAILRRGTVVRERRATFSLAPGEPRRPGVETPVEGLYLAGDWIDTGLPGTIESAAMAGHQAARALTNRQSSGGNLQ